MHLHNIEKKNMEKVRPQNIYHCIIHVKNEPQNPSETLGQNYDFTMEQPLLNNYQIKWSYK